MQGLRRFELLENLESGGVAKAALLVWEGERYVRSKQIIDLHEFVGIHGLRGDRGFAFLSAESGKWEAASGLSQQIPQWSHV
ncbi:MAG TPA: hypothetical protein VGJ26_05350 [Pirellulales bacterium]|jgi:hypothetical protein